MTTIVAAALNIDGLIITKPKPARHHDLIHPFYDLTGRQIGPQEQGFLTSDGEYVDRKPAYLIALSAGQLTPAIMPGPDWTPDLFSEDLW